MSKFFYTLLSLLVFFSFSANAVTFICKTDSADFILINEKDAKERSRFGYVSDAKLIISGDTGSREYDAVIVSKDWYGEDKNEVIFLKGHTYNTEEMYGLYVFFFRIEKNLIQDDIVFRIWYGLDDVYKGTCTKSS